jgi:hypothetical protein
LLLSLRPYDYRTYYQNLYAPGAPGIAAFRDALRGLGAALRQDKIPGTLLIIPEMHEPRDAAAFAAIYRDVTALALDSGFLEVVDPSPDFPPGPGRPMWVTGGDSHPDGRAQGLMAAALVASRGAKLLDGVPPP